MAMFNSYVKLPEGITHPAIEKKSSKSDLQIRQQLKIILKDKERNIPVTLCLARKWAAILKGVRPNVLSFGS
jgi:hypothetical protein